MSRIPPRRAGAALAALAFFLWHGAAITLAPYPDSAVRRRLWPVFEPYLRLAYLEHRWTFFGPHPDPGRLVGYEVVGEDGVGRSHPLSTALERGDPAFFRYRRLYDRVATGDGELRVSAARYLCRRHAATAPRGIRFVVVHQLSLSPELVRAGVRATDPEALRRETLGEIPCRSASGEEPRP